MGKNLGDPVISMRLRDTIERITKGVLNRERPAPFTAEVISYNIFSNKARVMTSGMLDASEAIEVNFTDPLTPNTSRSPDGVVRGNIVTVETVGKSLWITQIIDGEYRLSKGVRLVDPRVNGGPFSHVETESNHFTDVPILPPVGQTVYVGKWSNAGKTLWSNGTFVLELEVWIELFVNVRKRYRVFGVQRERDGVWRTLLPFEDTGVSNALDFAVEIKLETSSFELRIRNLRSGLFGSGGYVVQTKVLGNQYYADYSQQNTLSEDARPLEVMGRDETNTREDLGTVAQGPFASGLRHTIEVRQQQLAPPQKIFWNNAKLRWTGQWRVTGIGRSDLTSTGNLAIAMPPVGTNIKIHGYADGMFDFTTTDANGIPLGELGAGTALYYEPRYFGNGTSLADRFHIVHPASPFKVPSHWIFLAARAVDDTTGDSLLLGNGTTRDHWRYPTMASGFTSSGVVRLGYKCIAGRVFISGRAVKTTAWAASTTYDVAFLPVDFRPPTNLIFPLGMTGVLARAGVQQGDGGIQVYTEASVGAGASAYLDDIQFDLEPRG